MTEFEKKINPFFWVEYDEGTSVCLYAGEYCSEVFDERADEGFTGNGYDWESLAMVFLNEKMSELEGIIDFDSEAGMFCAFSSDKEALKNFILLFKALCEDKQLMKEFLFRAELI